MRRLFASLILILGISHAGLALPPKQQVTVVNICKAAEAEAKKVGLDVNFMMRLLWKESLFDPNAVSPKGAQGIAQFMPDTAERRGLADPFDPLAAVGASASYLADLKIRFGNLGLAAAAYNAGEARVEKWLAGRGGMPAETRDYVAFTTGQEVEAWRTPEANHTIPVLGSDVSTHTNCVRLASRQGSPPPTSLARAKPMPWGAMVATHFRQDTAMGMFRRLKVRFPSKLAGQLPIVLRKRNLSRGSRPMTMVMLGASTRAEAEAVCASLLASGAPCVVRKGR